MLVAVKFYLSYNNVTNKIAETKNKQNKKLSAFLSSSIVKAIL